MSGPSVLEYARYHRLSAPHTASDLSKYVSTISYAQIDDDALPELESPSQEDLFAESKLQLSSKAARCLAEMTKPPEPVCWEQVLKDPFRLQKLRIEPAMLSRDHETDMKWFKRPMDLSDLIKELSESCAPDTTESDDGAAFLDQCQSAAATTRKVIEYPHLETTPTALTTLLRSTQDQWTDGDLYRIYNETFTEAKKPRLEPLTPLLTPILPATNADVPPSLPEISLEPRSEQELEMDNLVAQVEQKLEETDQICTSDISNGTPSKVRDILAQASTAPSLPTEPTLTACGQPETSPIHKAGFGASVLKLEVPLLHSSPPRPEVGCEMREFIDRCIGEFFEFPGEAEESETLPCTEEDLVQHLDTYQSRVQETVNTEPPSINETTLRVQVPSVIDEPGANYQSLLAKEVAATHGITTYPMIPAHEARLNWVPIPKKLMQPDPREELEVSDSRQKFLTIPEHVTQSKDLLWKESGLRLLDFDTENDEELTIDGNLIEEMTKQPSRIAEEKHSIEDVRPDTQQQQQQLGSEQQKSTTGDFYASPGLPFGTKPSVHDVFNASDPQSTNFMVPRPLKLRKLGSKTNSNICNTIVREPRSGPAGFSASASIASFLDLRGNKFKKLLPSTSIIDEAHGSDLGRLSPSNNPPQSSRILAKSPLRPLFASLGPFSQGLEAPYDAIESTQSTVARFTEHVEVPSTPERSSSSETWAPTTIEAIPDSRIIVLDEGLISNKPLVALIDQQGEDRLRPIYRNLGSSPDVILSPTICLILTNLQALKQRSLPGQKESNSNTVQDRIRKMKDQYETIFVLTSISASATPDSAALMADFTSFCAAFQCSGTNVCPIWVAAGAPTTSRSRTGSPDPMTAWTWRLIRQHALPTQANMSFIDDTSLWELFLREAGVNALAAQLMLGLLKRDSAGDDVAMGGQVDIVGADWGLRRLVSMHASERRRAFAELVGEKCIERLNRALDEQLQG